VLDAAGGIGDSLHGGGGADLLFAADPPTALAGVLQDDYVQCDMGLRGDASGRDVAVIDRADTPAVFPGNGGHECDVVLFGPAGLSVAPGQPVVAVSPTCPAGEPNCTGSIVVRALAGRPRGGVLAPDPSWRRLGSRKFTRTGGRARKVKVPIPRAALRSVSRRGRVRAYVTFSYRAKRTGR